MENAQMINETLNKKIGDYLARFRKRNMKIVDKLNLLIIKGQVENENK
jgi:hypothetical protein